MSYAEIVLAMVPAAPPTWKNRRATSWPAPISAKVPYFFASRLIWNAFLSVPTSISAFIEVQDARQSPRPQPERAVGAAVLHAHAFDRIGGDPAALVIWERRVDPVPALAQHLELASGRQDQDALGVVGRGYTRFGFFAGHHRQVVAADSVFQRHNPEY